MRSFTSRHFREMYAGLPEEVQRQARRAYRLFVRDPWHRSLKFKKADEMSRIYSVRIGLGYRALGQVEGSGIVWFWIGPHSEYGHIV